MNIFSSVFINLYSLNKLTEKTRSDIVSFRGSPYFIWGNEYFIREILNIHKIITQIYNFNITLIYP